MALCQAAGSDIEGRTRNLRSAQKAVGRPNEVRENEEVVSYNKFTCLVHLDADCLQPGPSGELEVESVEARRLPAFAGSMSSPPKANAIIDLDKSCVRRSAPQYSDRFPTNHRRRQVTANSHLRDSRLCAGGDYG